jgi:G3E family GTPase
MAQSLLTTGAPTVLFVGFLGAGKTTFLRALLPLVKSRELEPYVLINDYQNARIDAGSLKHLVEEVEAINGNCICCDSIHELIDRLLSIPEKSNRVVLIEANGTTDPFLLIEHLAVHAELRRRFTPLLQVGVIDIRRWQNRAWHNELERLQAQSASHLVFSRADSAKPERGAYVRSDLEWFNPRSIETDPEKLADELARLVAHARRTPAISRSAVAISPPSRGHDHSIAHGFVAIQLDLPERVKGSVLYQWLRQLPDSVLRVKGVVQLNELPESHFVFQRIDDGLREPTVFPLAVEPTVSPCAVLIGVRLDEEKIRQEAVETFGELEKAAGLSVREVNRITS